MRKFYYIKWGFESRLKHRFYRRALILYYIKWGFESRLKPQAKQTLTKENYIKWGFESRLKHDKCYSKNSHIISNGDLRVD